MKNNKKEKKYIKNKGRIYTPDFIVDNILDLAGYKKDVLNKHIIDNSCGDGAFLAEIVKRYCKDFISKYGKNKTLLLKKHLEKYIHGIEIDAKEVEKCHQRLSNQVKNFKIFNVNWDINCGDTLKSEKYNHKMDYVVGNPPYVRVHNLSTNYSEVKKFKFCEKGMVDLYIVFFEIGFKMLKKEGKMCLITPSSFFRSKAGFNLRKYILQNKNLIKVVDLEHFQPFNSTAYTAITLFENGTKNDNVYYYNYDEIKKRPRFIAKLKYADFFIDGKIFLSNKKDLLMLHEIEKYNLNSHKNIYVKNGFATLADHVFIGNFNFQNLTINTLKASTGQWLKCIYPYTANGQPIGLLDIKQNPEVYQYLSKNEKRLRQRSIDRKTGWYLFGRNQAVRDVFQDKIAVNTIIKNENSIKLELVPAGNGVYSGLYILTDKSFNEVENQIKSKDFIKYLKLLKNYKSGGYYTFSSSDLQKFLSFKFKNTNYEQQTIFETNF